MIPPNYANYIKLLFTSFKKLIDWIPETVHMPAEDDK